MFVCAKGRYSFEQLHCFAAPVQIDMAHPKIDASETLKHANELAYITALNDNDVL